MKSNDPMTHLRDEFAREYPEKLFYFFLRKTGSEQTAQELSSDVVYDVLLALHNEKVPQHLPAWVWQIARNQYAKWADGKRRHVQSVVDADIGDCEIEDEQESLADGLIRREELSLLRRELSFISSDYRDIIVAYYMEDRKLKDIAAALDLPLGTVETKLFRARKNIKEGMSMAREFGKRSYHPENITYHMNYVPSTGTNGARYVERLISQNILLEAYDNPSTAEELALELGISMPYMEEELRFLLQGDMLIREGTRYKTAIAILSREAQETLYDTAQATADRLTPLVLAALDEIGASPALPDNQSPQDMRPALIDLYLNKFPRTSPCDIRLIRHADGSEWAIMGFENTAKRCEALGVWGHGRYHQIMELGNRQDDAALDIDPKTVPVFSRKTLPTLLTTSHDAAVAALLAEFDSQKSAILKHDIPAYLRDRAMYESGVDLRKLVIDRALENGAIRLAEDMNRSAIGVWNMGE